MTILMMSCQLGFVMLLSGVGFCEYPVKLIFGGLFDRRFDPYPYACLDMMTLYFLNLNIFCCILNRG